MAVENFSIITPFWDFPERYYQREVFTVGKNLDITHDHIFCLEGEIARYSIVYKQGLQSIGLRHGQGLGKNMKEKMLKKYLEKSMWISLPKRAQDLKIPVFHINVHQNVTSAEEKFNNQVDRMICSVYSQPLSPTISLNIQWILEHSNLDDRDGHYSWAQQHGLPLTKDDPLLNAISNKNRDQHLTPNMSPFHRVTNQLPYGHLATQEHFIHEKDKTLSLLQQILSGYRFASSDAMFLPPLSTCPYPP